MPRKVPRSCRKYKSFTIEAPKASVDEPAKAAIILLQSKDSKDCATAPQRYASARSKEAKTNTGRLPKYEGAHAAEADVFLPSRPSEGVVRVIWVGCRMKDQLAVVARRVQLNVASWYVLGAVLDPRFEPRCCDVSEALASRNRRYLSTILHALLPIMCRSLVQTPYPSWRR
ncbi:hypothetical protein KC364_g56 [Hortaea werneckii]|nr:hypothetical protein KC364_g56 [Hortaea werneckii]